MAAMVTLELVTGCLLATTPTPDTAEQVAGLFTRLVDAAWAAGEFLLVALVIYGLGRFVFVPLVRRGVSLADVEETFGLTVVRLSNASFVVFALYVAVTLSGLARTPTVTAAVAAAATIALGFAAQDVLGNLVSGAFIVMDPKFKIGDWIQWGDREGIIEDISFRVTRVHTFDNELVTIPNSELTANAVTNPVAKDHLRETVTVGIGYEDDIEEARRILRDIADDHEAILERPRATVLVRELAPSAVELTVRFWIADPARADLLRTRSEYVESAKERLEDAGIELPYPYRQLTGEVGTYETGGKRRPPGGADQHGS
jgi:small conductance mechanosensitive channel